MMLGTPPDVISEEEKIRRLQDISDRQLAARRKPFMTVKDIIATQLEIIALHKEEQALDLKYPSVPPVRRR